MRRQRTTPSTARSAAGLDDGRQGSELIDRKPGRMSLRADVLQPVGAAFVEPVNPVAQRLAVHAADPRGLLPIHAVENRRRQKPAALVGVPRPGRQPSQVKGRVVVRSFTAAAMARILLASMESVNPTAEKTP